MIEGIVSFMLTLLIGGALIAFSVWLFERIR